MTLPHFEIGPQASGVSAGREPTGLPWVLSTLVGRDGQVAELRRLLRRHRLVTLTGMGGVGKSRLALATAGAAGRAYWVEPAGDGTVAELVAAQVRAGEPHLPTLDRLARALSGEPALLVLDGCDHVLAACRELVAALLARCPELTVLATTRELLGLPGELTWPVPPLPVADAVTLFTDRARDAGLAFPGGPVVERTCRRLDGLPLAIELAAARVRVLSVEQIEAGLDNALGLLAAPGDTVPDRHRTLTATLDFSHDRLPPAEAAVFRRLSVFPAATTLAAVRAVIGDVLDELTRLVERSLVQVVRDGSTVRYRLPEAVRQYAAARLDVAGETADTRRRLVGWCGALLTGPGAVAGTVEWLDAVAADYGNLRPALVWAGAADAAGLAGTLWRFCRLRGRYADGRRMLDEVLARHRAAGPRWAPVLHGAGVLALLQCDYDTASARLGEALAADPHGLAAAEVLGTLSAIARERGDYARSVQLLRGVQERTDDAGRLRCAVALAMTALMAGELAVPTARTAVAAARRCDDPVWRTAADLLLGLAEIGAGAAERGAARLAVVLAESERQGSAEITGYALHGLGAAALGTDPARAAGLLRRALAVHEGLGDRWRTASVLDDLARCALATGDPAEATRLVAAADATRDAIGVPVPAAERAARDRLVAALGAVRRLPAPSVTPRAPLLAVTALGTTRVLLGERALSGGDWGYAKPRELLHLLLTGPARKASIGLALWPEADAAGLRGAFHTTLNRLRRAVGTDRIVYAAGRYAVDRSLPLTYDVDAFDAAVRAAEDPAEDPAGRERQLRLAAAAYGGAYLADETAGGWADPVRDRLQRQAERALLGLARLLLARGDPAAAIPYLHRALDLDPLGEAAHRGLMRCHARLGEPGRALRQYAELRARLADELRTEPAPESTALARRLQAAGPGRSRPPLAS